jgi:Tfp pilus assembly protein PilF
LSSETPLADRLNWLTQAEQQLRKSLELSDGKLAFSHLHLARVYEMRGEKLRAAQELESFLLKNPGAANEKNIREAITKLRQP